MPISIPSPARPSPVVVIHAAFAIAAVALFFSTGCATGTRITEPLPENASGQRQLDAGYALLRDLMSKEKNVDGILMIKGPTKETAQLIRDIASAAKTADERLASIAESSDALTMKTAGLPVVEQSARNSIESETAQSLVLSGGDSFEVQLLVAQAKATQYAQHLFSTLAEADDNESRSDWLRDQSEIFKSLGNRVLDRLTVLRIDDPAPSPDA